MTDEDLVKTAQQFRDGVLKKRSSSMMCAVVSWPLQSMLSALYGVELDAEGVNFPGGGNHVFLRLPDGRVLDATADQFAADRPDLNVPAVYLGHPILGIHVV